MIKYKPGEYIKYNFTGTDRYRLLQIYGLDGDYYTYKKSIQIPRLKLTRWSTTKYLSYVHINRVLFQDEECLMLMRKQKLERILNG